MLRLTCLVFLFLFLIGGQTTILSAEGKSTNSGIEQKIKVQTVASHLSIPWSIAFAEDGRIFFTERTGTVRVIDKNGILLAEPAATINVARAGEGGLLGIALDPDFGKNHYVYIYYTYS